MDVNTISSTTIVYYILVVNHPFTSCMALLLRDLDLDLALWLWWTRWTSSHT